VEFRRGAVIATVGLIASVRIPFVISVISTTKRSL
jgi:hypothetical protein